MKTESSISSEEMVGLDNQDAVSDGKPQRIGGLLILIMIGLFLSLIQNSRNFLGSVVPIFRTPLWDSLTNPESTDYHHYWTAVLIYDAATSSLILIMNIVMLWLFFRKKRVFPKLIVVSIPLMFVIFLAGYFLSGVIPAVAESKEYAKQGQDLIVRFVGVHIWIPYFLLSKRVGRTFVR
jgi:Protein of unknown function (DUF2569)